jgi:hypothetical protein
MHKTTNQEFIEELRGLPSLDEVKTWPLETVVTQYRDEQRRHIETLERQGYFDGLSRHYRLGYMRWLLNGSPQPQPRLI